MSSELARWKGKIALVTGASSGIGRALALDLAALGIKVALTGRRREALESTASAVRAAGGSSLLLPGDQTDPDTNRGFFSAIQEHWGTVDLLINNAGVLGGQSLLKTGWPEIQAAIDLNIRAALLCMREAAAHMADKSPAAIINISSMTGHRVAAGTPAVYAATKHALRILTDGLRNELLEAGSTVKVALLSPGLVDTPWHAKPDGLLTRAGAYPYPPLQPADLAAAVRYILSAPPGVQVCDILLRPFKQPF